MAAISRRAMASLARVNSVAPPLTFSPGPAPSPPGAAAGAVFLSSPATGRARHHLRALPTRLPHVAGAAQSHQRDRAAPFRRLLHAERKPDECRAALTARIAGRSPPP